MKIKSSLIKQVHNTIDDYLYDKMKMIDPSFGYLAIKDLKGIVRNNPEENVIIIEIILHSISSYVPTESVNKLMNLILLDIDKIMHKDFGLLSAKYHLNYTFEYS